MNEDRIKVMEMLADIQYIRRVLENNLKDKTGEQKTFTEGLIEAYKNVELRIFEEFALLRN
jgi:hypothetical protein